MPLCWPWTRITQSMSQVPLPFVEKKSLRSAPKKTYSPSTMQKKWSIVAVKYWCPDLSIRIPTFPWHFCAGLLMTFAWMSGLWAIWCRLKENSSLQNSSASEQKLPVLNWSGPVWPLSMICTILKTMSPKRLLKPACALWSVRQSWNSLPPIQALLKKRSITAVLWSISGKVTPWSFLQSLLMQFIPALLMYWQLV